MTSPNSPVTETELPPPVAPLEAGNSPDSASAAPLITAEYETKILACFKNEQGSFTDCLLAVANKWQANTTERDMEKRTETAESVRQELRKIWLFDKARLAFIEAESNRCIARAQDVLETGHWQSYTDVPAYLLSWTDDSWFEMRCSRLFREDDEERKAYDTYRTLYFTPLREKLDTMFQPLHAVTSLINAQKYIENSQNGVVGPMDRNVWPYQGLTRLAESIKNAEKLHQSGVPETYFSDAIKSTWNNLRQNPKKPNITFSEAKEEAKTLATILIRTEHQELQSKNPVATKEEFIKNLEAVLKDTGFTLENCGFAVKNKTTWLLRKKVVGYELIGQK